MKMMAMVPENVRRQASAEWRDGRMLIVMLGVDRRWVGITELPLSWAISALLTSRRWQSVTLQLSLPIDCTLAVWLLPWLDADTLAR